LVADRVAMGLCAGRDGGSTARRLLAVQVDGAAVERTLRLRVGLGCEEVRSMQPLVELGERATNVASAIQVLKKVPPILRLSGVNGDLGASVLKFQRGEGILNACQPVIFNKIYV
jgi:hypothetical protein